MSHTVDLATVPEWLGREVENGGSDVAVFGGHFAIFSAGATATDLLDDATTIPDGAEEMLEFTRLTWRWLCDAARANPTSQFRAVVMADDIQFVRPITQDRAVAERLAAALARDYFESHGTLPDFHLRELTTRGLATSRVLHHTDQRWLFSERDLRHAAVRRVRQHHTTGGGSRAGLTSSDNGNTMTVTLPEQGDYCLVHSGHTTCAGGYVELLASLYERGIRRLIAFVPMRCLSQVSLGTELAMSLFQLPGFAVTNVAVPAPGTSPSVVLDHGRTVRGSPAY